MKFKVDSEACQSATTCIAFNLGGKPIYELDDENKAEVLEKKGDDVKHVQDKWVDIKNLEGFEEGKEEDAKKSVLDSAKGCSFNAIIVQNDEGKQVWPKE